MKRFEEKFAVEANGCWTWTACKTRQGYGLFAYEGQRVLAHRFSYEMYVGPIPEGLCIDHLCRNTSCVNPAHLEPVTYSENNRRAFVDRQRPATCRRGHAWTVENTSLLRTRGHDGEPHRSCRQCRRERNNPTSETRS